MEHQCVICGVAVELSVERENFTNWVCSIECENQVREKQGRRTSNGHNSHLWREGHESKLHNWR